MSIESSNRWPKPSGPRKWWFALAALPALSCANGVDASASEAMNAASRGDAFSAGNMVPGQGVAEDGSAAPSATTDAPSVVPVAEAAVVTAPEAAAPEAAPPVIAPEAAAPATPMDAAPVSDAAPPATDAAVVARPATNTGTGFYAQNGKIYDA